MGKKLAGPGVVCLTKLAGMERSYYWEHPDGPDIQNQAEVSFEPGGLTAHGIQTGPGYSARWVLEALDDWKTQAIQVHVHSEGWNRHLELERDANGVWTSRTSVSGAQPTELAGPEMAPGIVPGEDLDAALDCDLGLRPVTNTMPIRRLDLLTRNVPETKLIMAWIEMPSLRVIASDQYYSSIDERMVRYQSGTRGVDAQLTVDEDGVVLNYPDMAKRL